MNTEWFRTLHRPLRSALKLPVISFRVLIRYTPAAIIASVVSIGAAQPQAGNGTYCEIAYPFYDGDRQAALEYSARGVVDRAAKGFFDGSDLDVDFVGCLIEGLSSDERRTRAIASDALAEAIDSSPEYAAFAVPDLVEAVGDDLDNLGPSAVLLQRIGVATLPGLLGVLNDVDGTARLKALWIMELLGSDAAVAGPRVSEVAAKDIAPAVREAATRVLQRIGSLEFSEIELGPSTAVNAYALGPEANAQWLKIVRQSNWTASFSFPPLPSGVSMADISIGLYDQNRERIETRPAVETFDRQSGTYFFRIYLERNKVASETVPVTIDIFD